MKFFITFSSIFAVLSACCILAPQYGYAVSKKSGKIVKPEKTSRKVLRQNEARKSFVKNYKGIVAKANGDIITVEDLKESIRLAEFMLGIQASGTQRKKFIEEVLKEKIHEQLKNQCLAKYAQKVDWVSKREVEETFKDLAKKYKMNTKSFEKFLASKGIKKESFLKKIKTELSWNSYINARYRKDVSISDSEAEKIVKDLNEKLNQESFFVSRMFFPVVHKNEEKSVYAHVNNIYGMLQRGANFERTARQFSKSADASQGGTLGWIFDKQLSESEMQALKKMRVGTTQIVKNEHGYVILFLQDRKEAGPRVYTNITFKQVVYPYEERPGKEGLKQLLSYIQELKTSSSNCKDFMRKATESGVMIVLDETSGILESMLPEYRSIIAKTKVGGISEPIITENGAVLVCVINKKINSIPVPKANEIKMQKINERLSVISERELQGLIKKASISVSKDYSLGADYPNDIE